MLKNSLELLCLSRARCVCIRVSSVLPSYVFIINSIVNGVGTPVVYNCCARMYGSLVVHPILTILGLKDLFVIQYTYSVCCLWLKFIRYNMISYYIINLNNNINETSVV